MSNPNRQVDKDREESDRTHVDALIARAASLMPDNEDEALGLLKLAESDAGDIGYLSAKHRALQLMGTVYLERGTTEDALRCLEESLRILEELDDKSAVIAAYTQLSIISAKAGKTSEALVYEQRCHALCQKEGDKNASADCCKRIGLLFHYLGDQAQALDWMQKGLVEYQDIGQRLGEAQCHSNLSLVYRELKQLEKAMECCNAGRKIYEEIGEVRGVASTQINLGAIYLTQQQYSDAYNYTLRGLELSRSINDTHAEVVALNSLGGILLNQGKLPEAREMLEECLRRSRDNKDHLPEIAALGTLGSLFGNSGKYQKALASYHAALDLAETNEAFQFTPTLLFGIAEVHEKAGELKQAIDYYQQYRSAERKVFNAQTDRRIHNLRILHETEQAHREGEIQRIRNEELSEANTRLEELVRAKNEFLGIAAHDMKNPLAAIRGLAHVIARNHTNLDKEKVSSISADIVTSAEHILHLVNGLLEVNRIEQGRLGVDLSVFSVSASVKQFLPIMQEAAKRKCITLDSDLPGTEVWAYADPDVIIQVLERLVSNAVKFSQPETSIRIGVRSIDREDGAYARISVRDNGPGIAAADMTKLFMKFSRLAARPTGGEPTAGLGLFIVKQLVEAMNGRVWCESEPGKGATFLIDLPGGKLRN